MHDVVICEFENHLAGNASPAFHSHLASCQECRAEVEQITRVSGMIAELRARPETTPEPPPFFFTRVAANIIEHQNTDHWGLLAPGAAFFRRIAFASLLLLAGLGSYLVTREGNYSGADAATVMAHDVTTAHPESSDRDLMLATLASYGE
jgi:hypothetical protein